MIKVEPEADALGEPNPFVEVLPNTLFTLFIKVGDGFLGRGFEGFDLRLARDAELALDLEFHRQPVRVPSGLAFDAIPLHGAETRNQILERACLHMLDARPAVRGRRADR